MKNFIKKTYLIIKLILILLNIKKYNNTYVFKNKFKKTIEKIGPLTIKMAQILSTRKDIISDDIISELKTLQTHVKQESFNKIKPILIKNNKNYNIEFKKINENALASASIAQIHTAISKKNEKLVIKIIKSDIRNIIKYDILLLKIISKIAHIIFPKFRRLKLIDIVKEIEKTLKIEINLENELINLTKIKKNSIKKNDIYIPNVKIELTSLDVLVMEYIDGINILNKSKLKKLKISSKLIIINLLNIFYTQLFKHKLFHADLHPGNILISINEVKKPIIILLDFGMISSIKEKEKIYLSKNLLAFSRKNYKEIAKLHIKAQTIKNNLSIQEIEKELFFIFEPILNKKIKNISFRYMFNSLKNLSKKFEMQTQPQMLLFQKTLLSIESISRQISPSINVWSITRLLLERIIIKESIINKIKKKLKKKIHIHSKKHNMSSNTHNVLITLYITLIFLLNIINI